MRRGAKTCLGAALAFTLLAGAAGAQAGRWEIRQEVREGKRSIAKEHLEARREIRRCDSRQCVRREMREGYREVEAERREARREIRREINEQRWDADRRGYWRDGRYYRLRDGRYYRYDRDRDRWYDDDDDGEEILKGALIGAAVVGVAAAIIESNDED